MLPASIRECTGFPSLSLHVSVALKCQSAHQHSSIRSVMLSDCRCYCHERAGSNRGPLEPACICNLLGRSTVYYAASPPDSTFMYKPPKNESLCINKCESIFIRSQHRQRCHSPLNPLRTAPPGSCRGCPAHKSEHSQSIRVPLVSFCR